jgi:2-polyprenyl-6-methoxyphenol hydroxylase-like FAD-dependent oxidoreductase
VSHTIRRADLHQGLRDLVFKRGIQIEPGKRLIDVVKTRTRIQAEFADGSTAEADLLIGCDGVHSEVRGLIDRTAPAPRFAGLLNAGGYATGVRSEASIGTYEMIFGKRAFFGYVTAPEGTLWWFANLPCRDEPTREERAALTGEELRRRLLGQFEDDAGPARRLIRATSELGGVHAIHTVSGLKAWHRGRMIVIGDAAHAPTPKLRTGRIAGHRRRRHPRGPTEPDARSARRLHAFRVATAAAYRADRQVGGPHEQQ